jgi:hypothetical protein
LDFWKNLPYFFGKINLFLYLKKPYLKQIRCDHPGVQQSYGGPIITPIVRKGESSPGVTRTAPLTTEETAHGAQAAK